MSAAHRILGQQYCAGPQDEVLIGAGLEIERPGEGDDELPGRGGVPREGAARDRLLKRDAGDRQGAAHQVAANARPEVDPALLEVRILIFAGPEPNAADHLTVPRYLPGATVVWARSASKKSGTSMTMAGLT